MMFWAVAGAMTMLAVAVMLRAARSGGAQDTDAAAYDLRVYRDQLAEVDRDLARGTLVAADAERVRTEVSRRILAADRARGERTSGGRQGPPLAVTAGIVAVLCALAAGSYVIIGAPGYPDLPLQTRLEAAAQMKAGRSGQAEAEAVMPPLPAQANPELAELVAQLREVVAARPDDPQGLRLLARNEANLGNFAAARRAQGRLIDLLGDQVRASDLMGHADLMILATGGYVSPEAEALLDRVIALDPTMGPAQYYRGLMHAQTGRPDLSLAVWAPLLEASDPRAPWVGPIREQIQEVAARAGVRYTLPPLPDMSEPAPDVSAPPLRGPTAEDVDAARDMSPDDRAAMIRNMVAGLADRLATEGGPPQDWARLIGALAVLGDTASARAIWAEAETVFQGQASALALIAAAAETAGLTP